MGPHTLARQLHGHGEREILVLSEVLVGMLCDLHCPVPDSGVYHRQHPLQSPCCSAPGYETRQFGIPRLGGVDLLYQDPETVTALLPLSLGHHLDSGQHRFQLPPRRLQCVCIGDAHQFRLWLAKPGSSGAGARHERRGCPSAGERCHQERHVYRA